MAPKSWAITDPERSATLLALPFRAFARVVRPVLPCSTPWPTRCLRLVGVNRRTSSPRCTARTSCACCWSSPGSTGCSAPEQHQLLTSMLQLQGTTVAQVMDAVRRASSRSAGDDPAERIEQASRRQRPIPARGRWTPAATCAGSCTSGRRSRATTGRVADRARDLMTPAFTLPATSSVTEAVAGDAGPAVPARAGPQRRWRRPGRSASWRWRTCWKRSSASSTTRPTRFRAGVACADLSDPAALTTCGRVERSAWQPPLGTGGRAGLSRPRPGRRAGLGPAGPRPG